MSLARVLLVEDHVLNRELAEAVLADAGYEVVIAPDGEAGLAAAHSAHPDVILMDIELPGLDGLEATRRLKADATTREIPVLALTAYAMRGDEERARAAGCDGYLTKPIDRRALLTALGECLAARRTAVRDAEIATVLVVDDHTPNREVLAGYLAHVPCEVRHAIDGESALAAVAMDAPDLILLDVMMPGLDGFTVLRRLKANPTTATIPVVLVTALAERGDLMEGLDAGADEFLSKPVDRVELLARVRTLLRLKRLRDEREAETRSRLVSSEQRYHDLVQGLDAIVWEADAATLQFTFVSQRAETILGYAPARWLAEPSFWLTFVHPDDRERVVAVCRQAVRDERSQELEYRAVAADGHVVWLRDVVRVIRDDGDPRCKLRGLLVDITERREAAEALRESEERYALAARGANDGLWDWNLRTDELYLSPRWKSMLGHGEDELPNRPESWLGRVHPADIASLRAEIAAHLDGQTPHFEHEHRILDKTEAHRWMLSRGLAVRDPAGRAYRMTGSQTDITQRKEAEAQLLHDALHDALTGLPNRALFMDRLVRLIERAQRQPGYGFAVLWLDLDRFKIVNDSLGHLRGDQLLVEIAQRLKTRLRPEDTVARVGGDEFTFLLEDIRGVEEAVAVADQIQEVLALPFDLHGHEVYTTASIGIALSTAGYERPEDMLRDADTAMYRAKALGKARHAVFERTMHTSTVALLQSATDLRRAIEHHDFEVYYQPIVTLDSGKLAGFEALVRWRHPDRGIISPAEFIPVAEDIGLIVPIGRAVLREACRQMRAWQTQFPESDSLAVSVNLSAKQLALPDIVEQIGAILWETGLDCRHLKLEITESVLMEDLEAITAVLQRLRAQGICISVDDFGTGYSSLSYLHRLPVDILKIDRSFITGLGLDAGRSAIVHAIITLARDLGMDVIAEGVETPEQLAQLKQLQCKHGQGYLFSMARTADDAAELIASERGYVLR
jgi:diguanylate cyclase (GGDEF)-like protein/PAS domain S-box-containing protein